MPAKLLPSVVRWARSLEVPLREDRAADWLIVNPAAVEVEDLAGDVGAVVAGEEGERPGDVIRGEAPGQALAAGQPLAGRAAVGIERGFCFCSDRAEHDQVRPDVV